MNSRSSFRPAARRSGPLPPPGILGTCPEPFGPVVAITSASIPLPNRQGNGRGVSLDLGCGPFGEGKDVALRAVVAGGGIGGIAAAVALARAGIDVRVYEQAQQLAEVGAGVSLAPNGLRMLERLGVSEGIGRMGARYVSAQLRFSDGRVMRHEPYQFALPGQNVGIHRADLLALLAGQLPPGTVRTGHRCTGFSQDAGGATVGFADGTTVTADVVMGADGIHSVLQGFVVAPAKPVFSGVVAYAVWCRAWMSTRPARCGCGWARASTSWCSRCGPGSC